MIVKKKKYVKISIIVEREDRNNEEIHGFSWDGPVLLRRFDRLRQR